MKDLDGVRQGCWLSKVVLAFTRTEIKNLGDSEKTVKWPRGLQTLRDTCSKKVLVVEEFSNRPSRAKLAQRYHSRDLQYSAGLETLAKDKTYLKGLRNKFIDNVYKIHGIYRACNREKWLIHCYKTHALKGVDGFSMDLL